VRITIAPPENLVQQRPRNQIVKVSFDSFDRDGCQAVARSGSLTIETGLFKPEAQAKEITHNPSLALQASKHGVLGKIALNSFSGTSCADPTATRE